MKTINMGNNESVSRGMYKNDDRTFTALTYTQSKTFKTAKSAEKWLNDKGFNKDGKRI
jgi:hypothetical protein